MKINQIVEAKKHLVMKAPRHKELNDALISKKAGGHFDKKSDYKRAKEKQKMQKELHEGNMPASVIRAKEKIKAMSAEEKKAYFAGKTKEKLVSMAWSHGYGKGSHEYAKYWDGKTGAEVNEATVSATTAATGQGRRHSIEMLLSSDELEALAGALEKATDEKLAGIKAKVLQLHVRSGKHAK